MGAEHSAAHGVSRQVHGRETCGAGPALPVEGWHGPPHLRGTHPPRGEHGGGGPDTRKFGAGLGRAAGGGSPSSRCGNEPSPGRTEPLGFLRQCRVRGGEGSQGGLRVPTGAGRALAAPGKGAKPRAQALIGSDLIRPQPKPRPRTARPSAAHPRGRGQDFPETGATPPSFSPPRGQPGQRPLILAPSSRDTSLPPPPMCPRPPKLKVLGRPKQPSSQPRDARAPGPALE